MKNIILLIIVGIVSCNNIIGPADVNDTAIRILVVDNEGANIIQKATPEFKVDDLRIYYFNEDMKYVQRFDGRLDVPDFITTIDSTYIRVQPIFGDEDGTYVEGGRSTSYLDFGNGDIDTIQVAGRISSSVKQIHDVWYNGVQVQSLDYCEFIPCGFTVVK